VQRATLDGSQPAGASPSRLLALDNALKLEAIPWLLDALKGWSKTSRTSLISRDHSHVLGRIRLLRMRDQAHLRFRDRRRRVFKCFQAAELVRPAPTSCSHVDVECLHACSSIQEEICRRQQSCAADCYHDRALPVLNIALRKCQCACRSTPAATDAKEPVGDFSLRGPGTGADNGTSCFRTLQHPISR
jgi:hypothetical protein